MAYFVTRRADGYVAALNLTGTYGKTDQEAFDSYNHNVGDNLTLLGTFQEWEPARLLIRHERSETTCPFCNTCHEGDVCPSDGAVFRPTPLAV